MNLELINFDQPSETRQFEKVRFDLFRVGPATLGRATYEPGWRWSEHVAPTVGTASCQVEHVGLVLSGQAVAKLDDGTERLMKAGDFFPVPPSSHSDARHTHSTCATGGRRVPPPAGRHRPAALQRCDSERDLRMSTGCVG
jgi:quercetin dioxygenase-like cupin family protein